MSVCRKLENAIKHYNLETSHCNYTHFSFSEIVASKWIKDIIISVLYNVSFYVCMHKASIRCKALSLPFILKTKFFSYFRLNNATQSCTILQDNHVKHIFIFLLPEHVHNTNHLPVGEQLQVPDLHGGFHHPLLDAGCGQPRHVSQGTACLEAVSPSIFVKRFWQNSQIWMFKKRKKFC